MSRTILVVPYVLILLASQMPAQISGAIYTTDRNGGVVNGNLYNNKRDVYLSGGPSGNCGGNGLPDGDYYFQVTDPSGVTLLSSDSLAERRVRVSGGIVSTYLGTTHGTRRGGPCGALLVQVSPFNDTPNNGGEYKVWVTPVARYDLGGAGFSGFIARYSKTDNFKIRGPGQPVSQCVIRGYKFFDHSEDGTWNPGVDPLELPIAGWRIEILRNSIVDGVTYTDSSGQYVFIRNLDNTTYTIREVAPGGFINDGIAGARWLATTPRSAPVTTNAAAVAGPTFGNLSFEVKVGVGRTKGFWHNNNGHDLLLLTDPRWRDALTTREGNPVCLRRNISTGDPVLSIFAPLALPVPFETAFQDWAGYVVGDPALGHGGFILSTQVAAALLNNCCGYMQFTAYIDRFQDGVLVSFNDMARGAIGLLCDPHAGLTGPHDPYQELRDRMLGCVNEFGSINNSGDPLAPQVVFGPTLEPNSFFSPY